MAEIDDMKVSEMQSELDERGVKYTDVVSVPGLRERLRAARSGEIPPSDELVGDDPEMIKRLMSNPDILKMLANPKFQKIMKEAAIFGPAALDKYMEDPTTRDMLQTAADLLKDEM